MQSFGDQRRFVALPQAEKLDCRRLRGNFPRSGDDESLGDFSCRRLQPYSSLLCTNSAKEAEIGIVGGSARRGNKGGPQGPLCPWLMVAETSPRLAGWGVGGLTVRELPLQGKLQSESSGARLGELPEVVAASGRRATILPKWPHLSLPPTIGIAETSFGSRWRGPEGRAAGKARRSGEPSAGEAIPRETRRSRGSEANAPLALSGIATSTTNSSATAAKGLIRILYSLATDFIAPTSKADLWSLSRPGWDNPTRSYGARHNTESLPQVRSSSRAASPVFV